jgi:poly-gamma-glutamate synthesis protein (capsule biosynthesis protein)
MERHAQDRRLSGGIHLAPFTLALGADIIPTRRLGPFAPDVAATIERVRAADLAIGNFEMPLTAGGAPLQKLLNIRADPAIAADVPSLGFAVLTLANNHAVDYGWEALEGTARLLRHNGIAVIGAGENRDSAAAVTVREVAGRRVGVIAFSCLTPTGMSASPDRPGISALHVETAYEIDPWYQMEEPGDPSVVKIRTWIREADRLWAEDLVARARRGCDLLVVTIHWGYGSGELLARYQRPLAEALIEAGADVIHGHHPHAIHPIGFHLGKPIFYGLGTIIGQQIFLPAPAHVLAMWADMSPDGALAELRFDAAGALAIELHPTTMNGDRLPVRATEESFERIASRLSRLSAPYGASVARRGGTLLVAPLR